MRCSVILAISIFIMFPAFAFSATLKVPSQYPTIQDAINVASGGDTVLVAPGTYVENIDFLGKAITVESEQGPAVTVIDGNHVGRVVAFQNGEGSDSILEGFTITNGYIDAKGGGIYCYASAPTITKNIVIKNYTTGIDGTGGGGIFCGTSSHATITNNIITGNLGCNGGGIRGSGGSSPLIFNNTIYGNVATYKRGGVEYQVVRLPPPE